MTVYTHLRELIEHRGCHPLLGPEGQGWGIEQNAHELATFLTAISHLPIQTVLEIGTGHKAGLARFLAYDYGCKVTTVDIQDYGHAALYPDIEFVILEWADVEYPVFQTTFDLVFIDGNHQYEAVRFDLEYYGGLAPVIAFHDIAGLRDCEGVARFWREISRTKAGRLRKECYEVIDDSDQRAGIGWGIGWVVK